MQIYVYGLVFNSKIRENVRILEAHNDHFPNLGDLESLIIEVIE